MTTEEKIRIIENTNSFAEVPMEVLPPSHRESYYFVSYSHKDYKMVLADILRLEELGVNIWYDNEMHIGENWQEIAQLYISKFQCAGVIFYLTENSISSPACNQEVEYVLTHNKNFISINKPLYGRQVESGYSMLSSLAKEGMPCSDELLSNFKKAFGDNILYLSADESIEKKASQILAIPREDLLDIETVYSRRNSKKTANVAACKDNTIINLDLSKIYKLENTESYENSESHIGKIGDCVFTNAIKLCEVKISGELEEIGESAFRNCISLTDIDLSKTDGIVIGRNAFRGCKSLANIDLTRAERIGEDAFNGCTALTSITASGYLDNNAFAMTNITDVNYLGGHSEMGYMTFYGCKKLKSFKTEQVWSNLGDSVFSGCQSLTDITPLLAPKVIEGSGNMPAKLGSSAFGYCTSLKKITLSGDWDLSIAGYAFSGCSSLEEIEYEPYSLKDISLCYGFAKGCGKLKKMGSTERFAKIGKDAFSECVNLSSFDFTSVTELEESAFAESGIEKVYLPKVEKIGRSAFALCKDLKHLQIGARCKSINDYAFLNCENLKTVKILSENIEISVRGEVFANCKSIEVFYLKSRAILNALERDGILDNIAILYIGDNIDTKPLALEEFTMEESDEPGFLKFVHNERVLSVDPEEEIQLWDAQLNEPDEYREKYDGGFMVLGLSGRTAKIKHARLKRPRSYFIERVELTKDTTVDYLLVSTHEGKSFKLDGTLIEEITETENAKGLYFRIPKGYELTGKSCCITVNGEYHYCTVEVVEPVMLYGVPMPIVNRNTAELENVINSIVYCEDDKLITASGLDIDSIIVFNDDFEVEMTINKPEI